MKDEEAQTLDGIENETQPDTRQPSVDIPDKKDEGDSPSDTESGISLSAVDWESPTDPLNPMNWSVKKKAFHTAIPAFYGFVL